MKRGCDLLILFLRIKIKRSQRAAAPTDIACTPSNNPDGRFVFQATDAFASKPAPTMGFVFDADPMWERACSRRGRLRQHNTFARRKKTPTLRLAFFCFSSKLAAQSSQLPYSGFLRPKPGR
ncbi:hypothetical protein DBR18_17045 [Pseudomonas sp. HMWF021]|nr:hypothetical protein DBR18_17045 [Pseudomonas sp. HMWF021]